MHFSLVKIGINYPHAIISMKLMKFTELYTATKKRGKQLRKSENHLHLISEVVLKEGFHCPQYND